MANEKRPKGLITRRSALGTLGASVGAIGATSFLPNVARMAHAQGSGPIRLGLQLHRTGIGSVYGRWYERVATAAVARINDMGGINGREVELIAEDDGTEVTIRPTKTDRVRAMPGA